MLGSLAGLKLGGIKRGTREKNKGEGQRGGSSEAVQKLVVPLYTVLAGGVTLTPQTRRCLLVVVFAALAGSFVERTPTHTRSKECGGGGWGSGCDSRRGSRLLQKLERIIWIMQCINGLLTGSRWTPSLLATAL